MRNDEVRVGEACRDEGADLRARAGEWDLLRSDGLEEGYESGGGAGGRKCVKTKGAHALCHSVLKTTTNLSRSLCAAAAPLELA